MADSLRETMLIALDELLSTINTGNDYETNMGNSVNRGLRSSLDVSDLPAIVLMEGTEDIVTDSFNKNTCLLPVMIHGYHTYTSSDDGNWSKVGNRMIADIVKCVGSSITISGTAVDARPGIRIINDPDPETNIMSVQVDFVIQYRTGYLDPYNA